MHVTVTGHTGLMACPGEGIDNVLKLSWDILNFKCSLIFCKLGGTFN